MDTNANVECDSQCSNNRTTWKNASSLAFSLSSFSFNPKKVSGPVQLFGINQHNTRMCPIALWHSWQQHWLVQTHSPGHTLGHTRLSLCWHWHTRSLPHWAWPILCVGNDNTCRDNGMSPEEKARFWQRHTLCQLGKLISQGMTTFVKANQFKTGKNCDWMWACRGNGVSELINKTIWHGY